MFDAAAKIAAPLPVTIDDIRAAQAVIEGRVKRTPCEKSRTLSNITGVDLWLKMENLQFTASFKERGALNRLHHLSEEERTRGVIAMSAGNHAQGVAYHAKLLGIPATIVMPETTPLVKVEGTRAHGAAVVLAGSMLEQSANFARARAQEKSLTFIHPYDDPLIIAGQGTVAVELLEQAPDVDCIVVPVGGGGLIAGMAVAVRALRPQVRLIGVQTELYPAMTAKLRNEPLSGGGESLAEGIAVKNPGRLPFEIIDSLVDDMVLVSEIHVEHAVGLMLTIEKSVAEGAGAAGLAAILAYPERFRGRKVGLPITGGNIDTRLLAGVLERELAREGRLARLSVHLKDQPGQLSDVTRIIAENRVNVVEITHQRVFTTLPARSAVATFEVETRDRHHLDRLVNELKAAGYAVVDERRADET
jgi:threonine dehydratase